jgi:site-specific DNA recombinase
MRAFIYCRVSTKEQGTDDHYSLDNQEQRGRDYLKMKKWRLAKLRKDVASGKNDERDGFQELLQCIRDGKIDVVVVYRLDRLSRNVRDIYDFLDSIQKSGVAFVSVTEGFDTTTAMGRAMLGVAAVFAQLTREMISENCRDGLMRRAEAGLFNGNKTKLYGYGYDSEKGLIVDAEEGQQVHQIFDWFTEHGWGTEKIARMLNLRGVPTKTGIQWSANSIAVILRNRVYRGEVRANSGYVPGQQEAIIEPQQFEQAQAIIQSRSILPSRTHDSPHLLSGIAHCGYCGKRLTTHAINQGKQKKRYDFYYHKADITVGENRCGGLAKSARLLESAVIEQIERLSQQQAMQKIVLEDVRKRRRTSAVPVIKECDKLLLELEAMGDKFSQWADRLDAGRIDEDQFDRQNARLLKRKNEVQVRLAELQAEIDHEENLEVSLAEVKKTLLDFPKVWDALEPEERREVLRSLVEELKVFKDRAELKLLFLDPIEVLLAGSRRMKAK